MKEYECVQVDNFAKVAEKIHEYLAVEVSKLEDGLS